MEAPFYADGLRAHGLEVVTPDAEQRAEVHRTVYEELVRGVVVEESRQRFAGLIGELAAQGCEAVLLACTEFGLLGLADADRRAARRHDRGPRRRPAARGRADVPGNRSVSRRCDRPVFPAARRGAAGSGAVGEQVAVADDEAQRRSTRSPRSACRARSSRTARA